MRIRYLGQAHDGRVEGGSFDYMYSFGYADDKAHMAQWMYKPALGDYSGRRLVASFLALFAVQLGHPGHDPCESDTKSNAV